MPGASIWPSSMPRLRAGIRVSAHGCPRCGVPRRRNSVAVWLPWFGVHRVWWRETFGGKAPHTFAARIDAEAWAVAVRRKIDKDQWDATDDNPKEAITFGVYAARWLANRQVAGRPIKARTREHYSAILEIICCPRSGTANSPRSSPPMSADWYEAALVDRPTMRSHAYSLLRTILASAVNDEIVDANPARIVGAGRSQAGP